MADWDTCRRLSGGLRWFQDQDWTAPCVCVFIWKSLDPQHFHSLTESLSAAWLNCQWVSSQRTLLWEELIHNTWVSVWRSTEEVRAWASFPKPPESCRNQTNKQLGQLNLRPPQLVKVFKRNDEQQCTFMISLMLVHTPSVGTVWQL